MASQPQPHDQGRDTRWYGVAVGFRVGQKLEGFTVLAFSNTFC